MKALHLHAGPAALRHLRERGLRPQDVAAIPAAAGGPKGLVLNPLDQYLFGEWLPRSDQVVHLLGASIGAWRMGMACFDDPVAALLRLGHDYIHQRYEHPPGKRPTASYVSARFAKQLNAHFAGHESMVLKHPRYRLHVFTSHGRHVLGREGRVRTPLGYLAAFAANAMSRRAMGAWLERVVFSDPRDVLPVPLDDYRSHTAPLTVENLQPAIFASCSIPFWLDAVHDIPGAPRGAYWDGGITDYHLHLNYAALLARKAEGDRHGDGHGDNHSVNDAATLVLYPHFQSSIVPGWLDKPLKRRHLATPMLDNVVVLTPNPEWVRTLPNGKLPDRSDFDRYVDDVDGRRTVWQRAVDESERLRDDFAALMLRGGPIEARPL